MSPTNAIVTFNQCSVLLSEQLTPVPLSLRGAGFCEPKSVQTGCVDEATYHLMASILKQVNSVPATRLLDRQPIFFISLDLLVLLYSSRSQQNVHMNNWRAQSVTTLPCVMKVTPLWNNAILNTGSVAACSPRPSGRLGDLNSLIVVDVLLFVFTEAARASGHTCQLTSNRVAGPGFFFKHHLWFPSVNDG